MFVSQVKTKQQVESASKLARPNKYSVFLINDDFTPQDFVVWILETVFYKVRGEARQIMMEAHTKGKAVCGVYTHDEARTKVMQVRDLAENEEYPLECRIEVFGVNE